jgi:hypothetical protein
MPKPIIRKEDGDNGVVGKPIPVNKVKKEFEMMRDIEEEEKQKDDNKPLLNFRQYSMDPPRTMYDDQGSSSQDKILGEK